MKRPPLLADKNISTPLVDALRFADIRLTLSGGPSTEG